MSESAEKIMGKAAARGAAIKPKGIGVIEACQYVGCGQTKMWELIKDGKVRYHVATATNLAFAAGGAPFTIPIVDVSGESGNVGAACYWRAAQEAIGIGWGGESAGAASGEASCRSGSSRCDNAAV